MFEVNVFLLLIKKTAKANLEFGLEEETEQSVARQAVLLTVHTCIIYASLED